MKTAALFFSFALLAHMPLCGAAEEGMTQMPKIQSKTSIVASDEKGEELLEGRGFGDKEPTVRMMNLMMVEGSGLEGMEMNHEPSMKTAANDKRPTPPSIPSSSNLQFEARVAPNPAKIGANVVTISIRESKSGAPKKGLKPKAEVYMTSMDMGTDEPRVRETSPGQYELKATFSMKGPWAVKLTLAGEEKIFNFDVGK